MHQAQHHCYGRFSEEVLETIEVETGREESALSRSWHIVGGVRLSNGGGESRGGRSARLIFCFFPWQAQRHVGGNGREETSPESTIGDVSVARRASTR